jgi:hypothetical protein
VVSGESLLLSGIRSLELPNLPPKMVSVFKGKKDLPQDGHGDLKGKKGMAQVR